MGSALLGQQERPLPQWFDDAKFGIMIHWGLYSIPGWAERSGSIQDLWSKHGPNRYFKQNPYAEWYANTIQIPGSAAQRQHAGTYGQTFKYEEFAQEFRTDSDKADFSEWADLFVAAGARYAVLTTKHMDGFGLWPSHVPNPHKPDYHAIRDIVGEVTEAVRSRGLKVGLYYSAGYDMTFNDTVIRDAATAITAIPCGPEYAAYVDGQIREIIERYQPSVLWNDIAYPKDSNLEELTACYYENVPEGVVNDRWARIEPPRGVVGKALLGAINALLPALWPVLPSSLRRFNVPQGAHYDFATPEYAVEHEIQSQKWEAVRGIGPSFGNNRNEQDEDLPSGAELVWLLVDVVSKNGNLLLGVGPEPNGDIPPLQRQRLEQLGAWLTVNGEAVFETSPWRRAEGTTDLGNEVRFTSRDDVVYAIVRGPVPSGQLLIRDFRVEDGTNAWLLGHDAPLAWEQRASDLSVTVPAGMAASAAIVLRVGADHR